MKIAAIRSGTDPVGKLPEGSFPRTLEQQIVCPKCDATYSLVVDWDQSLDRWFEESARPLLQMLRKAVFLGHADGHTVTHFETAGVVVTKFLKPKPVEPTRVIQ
ncbi:MAG: hypothetical protein KGK08_02725 [Acidobacteriota bacterium]|nr:hypothetical protein [Acidobacteriota bacterium]